MRNYVDYFMNNNVSNALQMHFCGWEKCKENHFFGPAIRAHYLLHFILEGKGKYYVDGQCYTLSKGQAFLICPGVSTYYVADSEIPWEYCWVGFDGFEVQSILLKCGLTRETPILSECNAASIRDKMMALIKLFEIAEVSEYEIIGRLYLVFSIISKERFSIENSSDKQLADKASEYIRNNFYYDIKINDIAKVIGLSRSYLYKIFIKKHNLSPQQYLINHRLHTAASLLKKTTLNITEVSFSCGFKDTSSFTQRFKKEYGMVPHEYRKNKLGIAKRVEGDLHEHK